MNIFKSPGLIYKPSVYRWIFLALLMGIALYYNFGDIGQLRPAGNHIWRQCDCVSLALGYYQGDMNFFSPVMNNLQSDGCTTGLTTGEFPILYYAVAVLWKIFGYHEAIYKMLVLLIAFAGLYSLYRMLEDLLKDSLWAMLFSLLMFTSPIIVFYSVNFLTNIPAFSFNLIALYFFYLFIKKDRNRLLWISMIFFALAGLIKVSALISLAVIIFLYITEALHIIRYRKEKPVFSKPLKQILPFLMVIIVMAAWYYYAWWFNHKHGGKYTFNHIWPIWEQEPEKIAQIWKDFTAYMTRQIFSIFTLIATGLMLLTIIVLTALRKIPWQILLLLFVLIFGVAAYFLLWYAAFNVHDYYMIEMMIFFVVVFTAFAYYMKSRFPRFMNHWAFRIAMLALLVYGGLYTRNNLQMRLFWNQANEKTYLCYTSNHENGLWWYNWDYNKKFIEPFYTIEAYNRSLGIQQEDKVVSLPDGSINISLVLMNQRGWNGFGAPFLGPAERMQKMKELGARYLFISDPELYNQEYLKPYISKKLGSYMGVDIYDIQ